ncbi:hypothetical protein NCS55_00428900 [Fusarium keratoplasticum]|nr:hypothetical protein NCS55_00428900 [Fusarium keratoplasticum]
MNNILKLQRAGTKRPLDKIDESPAKKAQKTSMQQPATSKHSRILKWAESIDCDQDTRDTNGFTTPTLPSPGTSSSADRSNFHVSYSERILEENRILEEGCFYLRDNLEGNGIYFDSRDPTPEHITNLINQIRQDRDSPGPMVDEVKQDEELRDLVCEFPRKSQVEKTESLFEVSTPVPDAIYGYKAKNAFPQLTWSVAREDMIANDQLLMLPFLVVEILGDDSGMWGAICRCMRGSASCVNMVEKLNRRVKQCTNDTVHPINSAAFSIAIRGTHARLHVSWKQDEDYHTEDVDTFLLQVPEHYIKFYKYVHKILDWGKGERLEEIRNSLGFLQTGKESQEKALAVEKPTPGSMPNPRRSRRLQQIRSRRLESNTPAGKCRRC